MIDLLIRPDGQGPLYAQVYRALRGQILSGQLSAGAKLPPTRVLAAELGTSRNVVVLAFEQLISEGYAESLVGSGTYVAAALPDLALPVSGRGPSGARRDESKTVLQVAPRLSSFAQTALRIVRTDGPPRANVERAPRFDFRYGRVAPDSRGLDLWQRVLAREARKLNWDYGAAIGDRGLREAVSQYLQRSRAVVCSVDQVMIVTGSQQGLDLTARVMLRPGDATLIEEPQYRGARQVFLAAGSRLIPAPVDAEGLNLQPIRDTHARLVYVTPSHQFPTGAVMSLSRRLALLEWAKAHDAYVVEDDYDSEFRYQGRPIEAVQGLDTNHRTIYVGTFSKVLSPALRVGYMVLPPQLVEAFRAAKWLSDRHTPLLEQVALARFIEEGYFEQHLRRMRQVNARRRSALLDAVGAYLGPQVEVTGTNAGLHLLLWIRDFHRAEMETLQAQARSQDVGVYSVSGLYLSPPQRAGLLMGYACLSEPEIEEGIRRLGNVMAGARAHRVAVKDSVADHP